MLLIKSITSWFALNLNKISGICLVVIMSLSCLDIVFRVIGMPFPGTYEIVGFLSALMISFSMAQTTIDRGHVAVEVFMSRMPRFIQKISFVAINLILAVLFACLARETIKYGDFYRNSGELSLTLRLPFYYVLYAMGLSFAVSTLVPMVDVIMILSGRRKVWFNWQD